MNKITAIVLTKNEERFLPGCLNSLSWVDELLVIDAESNDGTVEIAKKHGAKVVSQPWQGFPKQRNIGAEHASHEWLLYVDADERISQELKNQIKGLLTQDNIPLNSYKVPHKNIILGKWLKYGGWYPEYQHRLLRKSALNGWEGELHEHPNIEGEVGTLDGNLIHFTHRGLEWMLKKTIRYVRMEAQLRLKANHPKVKVRHLFSAPLREFWFRAIKKQGYRGGIVGWIEIIYQAMNHFLIMAWLWEIQQKQTMDQTYNKLDEEFTKP